MPYSAFMDKTAEPGDWLYKTYNEKGSKVEADVAMCPLLSLFRREENRDGDTYVPYALHIYLSTATLLIGKIFFHFFLSLQ